LLFPCLSLGIPYKLTSNLLANPYCPKYSKEPLLSCKVPTNFLYPLASPKDFIFASADFIKA